MTIPLSLSSLFYLLSKFREKWEGHDDGRDAKSILLANSKDGTDKFVLNVKGGNKSTQDWTLTDDDVWNVPF